MAHWTVSYVIQGNESSPSVNRERPIGHLPFLALFSKLVNSPVEWWWLGVAQSFLGQWTFYA